MRPKHNSVDFTGKPELRAQKYPKKWIPLLKDTEENFSTVQQRLLKNLDKYVVNKFVYRYFGTTDWGLQSMDTISV